MCLRLLTSRGQTQRRLSSIRCLRPGDFQGGILPEVTGKHSLQMWAGNALNGVQTKVTWLSTNLKETQLPEEFPLWDWIM